MADHKLNLEGSIQPFGLLLVANTLTKMNPGEVLNVMVPDRELLENIIKIVRNSQHQVLDYGEHGTNYRISIIRGDFQ